MKAWTEDVEEPSHDLALELTRTQAQVLALLTGCCSGNCPGEGKFWHAMSEVTGEDTFTGTCSSVRRVPSGNAINRRRDAAADVVHLCLEGTELELSVVRRLVGSSHESDSRLLDGPLADLWLRLQDGARRHTKLVERTGGSGLTLHTKERR